MEQGKELLEAGCGMIGPAGLTAAGFGLDVTGVDLLDWRGEATSLGAQGGSTSRAVSK